jgi:hypothetical protein
MGKRDADFHKLVKEAKATAFLLPVVAAEPFTLDPK